MIKSTYIPLKKGRGGKYSKIVTQRTEPIMILICDDCNQEFERLVSEAEDRKERWGSDYCSGCLKVRNTNKIVEIGSKVLSSFGVEEKRKYAVMAGKQSAKQPNSGRFTRERFQQMTIEERQIYGKRANQGLQRKLQDPKYREEHFKKVFQHSRIGYISKGQQALFELIEVLGFQQEKQIGSLNVDCVHYNLKLIVEYYGDFYHCNPLKWKENDYNSVLKMTAKEKWTNDYKRTKWLEGQGFMVIIVWENGWITDQKRYVDRIRKCVNIRMKEGK